MHSVVDDSYYKIFEFSNVSSLSWTSLHRYVIIQIQITNRQGIVDQQCHVEVTSHPQVIDPYPLGDVERLKFRMQAVFPIIFSDEAPPQANFGYFISLVATSWNQAFMNCSQMGGQLLAIDSKTTWKILMENMHYVHQILHFNFWRSQLIFVKFAKVSLTMIHKFYISVTYLCLPCNCTHSIHFLMICLLCS